MPNKTRYGHNKRRRTYRKRPVPPSVKSYVNKQINKNIELVPYEQPTGAGALIGPTVNPLSLTTVPVASREGGEITIKSLLSRYYWLLPATAPANISVECRLMFFRWKPISVPLTTDILQNTVAANIIRSPIKQSNYQLIKVLKDYRFTLTQNERSTRHINFYHKYSMPVKYNDIAAPATATNLLYVLFISDQAAVANQPQISYYTRLMFNDA